MNKAANISSSSTATTNDSSQKKKVNGTSMEQHDFDLHEPDHYKVLGVSEDCSSQEIKKAYISLSRRLHPDKNRAVDAKEKFQRLGTAFAILHDEVRSQSIIHTFLLGQTSRF
jgi:DnaJ-class molecular chaperone